MGNLVGSASAVEATMTGHTRARRSRDGVPLVHRERTFAHTRLILILVAAAAMALTSCATSEPSKMTSSPSGTPVAPQSNTVGLFNYVDLRTGAMTPMPENIADSWSMVSPDGTMFVYGCWGWGPLFVANVDGSDEHQVTPEGVDACLGAWSPDGSMIVYEADAPRSKPANIFTVDLATGEVTQLTDLERVKARGAVTVMEPGFSPDGESVFFHRLRRTARVWDIWSVPVTGGEPTIVRRNAGWGRYSPDGQTLAFLSDNGEGGRIRIADATGGPARQLVKGDHNGPPIWSPDGTKIAYVDHGIQVVDVATGETSEVTACGGPVEWFDDDTLIVGPGGC
jgi:Tol biopolymer transport system component